MGQRLATAAARPASPAAAAPPRRRTFYRVRREEMTPELLRRVAQDREAGRLGGVTLDCRKTDFDDHALDIMERAAGINRLVLEC